MTRAWLALVAALLGMCLYFKFECLGLERDLAEVKGDQAIQLKSISDAALAAHMSATQARDQAAKKIADIDAKAHASLTEKNREIDRLQAAHAADRRRLSVAASCAADPDRLPSTDLGPGMDHGAGPRLTPAAERHYFDLRRGIVRVTAQLSACQEYVRAVTSRTTNEH